MLIPTAYFGSISWFQQVIAAGSVEIEACDHFPKQTFRNRCTIVTPQGEKRLTIPVEKPNGTRTLTADIRISNHSDWRKDHWRAIQSAYASAPYFGHYAEDIHSLIYSEETNLLKFNDAIARFLLSCFGFELSLGKSTAYIPAAGEPDLRSTDFEKPGPAVYIEKIYTQVYFGNKVFFPNMSALDLLFCCGPAGRNHLIYRP